MNKIMAAAILSCLFFLPASAQDQGKLPVQNSGEPLEITARDTLEWQRGKSLFVARGQALARQGEVSIAADILTASHREGKEGQSQNTGMEIWRVEAENNVVIHSRDSTAYGRHAIYDMDKELAVMTGDDLRMVSTDQVITARESFEYAVRDGRLTAKGSAKVERKNVKGKTDTLEADTIIALLKEDAQGKRQLESLEALGNVVIRTETETLTGARGLYTASANKASLEGGVTLRRGANILQGTRAEMDLNTNTSRIFGSPAAGGERVRGVFYPGSEKTPQIPSPKGPEQPSDISIPQSSPSSLPFKTEQPPLQPSQIQTRQQIQPLTGVPTP